jgi:hypothetical protein
MAGVIKTAIVFALSNYSLTFLVVGLLFSIFAIFGARKPLGQAVVVEKLLAWHVFWAIGVGYLYNFVMHAFFGQMSATFIGCDGRETRKSPAASAEHRLPRTRLALWNLHHVFSNTREPTQRDACLDCF